MKIPFDITKRPQIESGEYKVETRDGEPARVVCWDRAAKESQPKALKLCVLVQEDGGESVYYYYPDGTKWDARDDYDLFIITPEPELTEWQRFISACLQKHGLLDCGAADRIAKECSAELLALARDQFIKEGYILEKKAFHDAVEKVSPEVMKEVSDKVDMEEALRLEYERGKAEALKDLPMWKNLKRKCNSLGNYPCVGISMTGEDMLYYGDKCISIKSLEKLPGFKED